MICAYRKFTPRPDWLKSDCFGPRIFGVGVRCEPAKVEREPEVAQYWWSTALDEAQRHGRRGQLNLSRARSYLSFYSGARSRGPVCSATSTLVPPWVADTVSISRRKRSCPSRSSIAPRSWTIFEGNRPADNCDRTWPRSDGRRSKRMRSRSRSWISVRSKKRVEQEGCKGKYSPVEERSKKKRRASGVERRSGEKRGTWNEYSGRGNEIVAAVRGRALGAIEARVTHLSVGCRSRRRRRRKRWGVEFAVVEERGRRTRWVFGRTCVRACVQARASSRGDARRGPEPSSRILLVLRRRRPRLVGAVSRRRRVTRMRECEREGANRAWLHSERGSSEQAISAPV